MNQILEMNQVTVVRDGKRILGPISWQVQEGEKWVILGPNGAGKTTLFQLASSNMHPTSGSVEILGSRLGSTDVFELRTRIGFMTNHIMMQIPYQESVINVVMTSAYGVVGRWQEEYDLWDESRAISLLTTLGIHSLRNRFFGSLSEGEKKRTLIARSLMPNPELLLLDEPAAGLDLGGREDLLQRLEALAKDAQSPATIIVTHHIEEIPIGSTHALLLDKGRCVAAGLMTEVVTSENLTTAYGLSISVTRESGRFFAHAI